MNILVINCGSSSLKYQLLDMTNQHARAQGLVERIGLTEPLLTHRRGSEKIVLDSAHQQQYNLLINDYSSAIALVIKLLTDSKYGVIAGVNEIAAVGHRVVHGGEYYSEAALIDDEVITAIEKCTKLAPLHNSANLIGIKSCQSLMPQTPMVAVFDTAFHQSMPTTAYLYALPYSIYEQHQVRRYGFHGTSHKFVATEAAKLIGRSLDELKLITCHLGNGASVSAVKYGRSIDTSMGFTPLAGLTMGTRCGDIDPSIIPYLAEELQLSLAEVNNLLNKQSGVLGISGVSSDFRDIETAASSGNYRAQLALDVFCYNLKKYIGAYAAAMNGVDAIIFTAGLGENDKLMRAQVIEGLSYLGVNLDAELNDMRGQLRVISREDATVKAIVVPTNEELMIALDTQAIITPPLVQAEASPSLTL